MRTRRRLEPEPQVSTNGDRLVAPRVVSIERRAVLDDGERVVQKFGHAGPDRMHRRLRTHDSLRDALEVHFEALVIADGRQRGHVDHGAQLGPPALGDRRPSSVLAAFTVSRAAGWPASLTTGHAGITRTGQSQRISPAMVIHPIPGSVARYVASSNASRKVWSSSPTCASWSPTKSMRSTSRVTSRMAA